MFCICQNVGSVNLRYRRLECDSVTGLALRCRAHICLSFNNFAINKCNSFGLFSSLLLTCNGACITNKTEHCFEFSKYQQYFNRKSFIY